MQRVLAIFVGLLLASTAWADVERDLVDCAGSNARTALSSCSRILKLEKFGKRRRAYIYISRGIANSKLKQYHRAIQDYDAAINLSPKNPIAHTIRGNAYFSLKQYRRAIQDYDANLRINPKDDYTHLNRGVAFRKLKQYRRSIQDFSAAIRLNPKSANAYGSRGLTHEIIGQKRLAIQDYRMALRLRPGDKVGTEGLNRLDAKP